MNDAKVRDPKASNPQTRIRLIVLASMFALFAMPAFAAGNNMPSGQCDITSNGLASPLCPSSNPDLAVTTTTPLGSPPKNAQAVRSDMGLAAVPVDVYGLCRYIDNNSTGNGTSIFVPFNSPGEWTAFIKAVPPVGNKVPFIKLNTCAKPWMPPAPLADTTTTDTHYCGSPAPVPNSGPSKLPYAPTSNSVADEQFAITQYTCTCANRTIPPWVETASQAYLPGDSDGGASQGGWASSGGVQYSGNVPAGCGNPDTGTWKLWYAEPLICGGFRDTCTPDPCSPADGNHTCERDSGLPSCTMAMFVCCSQAALDAGTCPPPP